MSSSYLQELSPNAEVVSKQQALRVNVAAAIGLQNVLKSNLGPTGTLKLLVGGAGQLKLTKDGLTLLKEMQIQHPTAALIARTATAQDDVTGDGTTSTVLLTGELLKQAEKYVLDSSIHPRILTDGLDLARDAALEFLARDEFTRKQPNAIQNRELLMQTARTSLGTKLDSSLVPKVRCDEYCCETPPVTNQMIVVSDLFSLLSTTKTTTDGLGRGRCDPDHPRGR
jgi:T-complex protein 1 subunit zeta